MVVDTDSRQESFGYVELATNDFTNLSLTPDPILLPNNTPPPHFIHVWRESGIRTVKFAVRMAFDLDSGEPEEWKRLRTKDFE